MIRIVLIIQTYIVKFNKLLLYNYILKNILKKETKTNDVDKL